MVDEDWIDSIAAAGILGITLNHLRQLQFRKKLNWGKRQGRTVLYRRAEVVALAEERSKKVK